MKELIEKAKLLKEAKSFLATCKPADKNEALKIVADCLIEQMSAVLQANALDVAVAQTSGMSAPLIDRLLLDEGRIKDISDSLREVANLKEPVGRVLEGWQIDNGLKISKISVPMGVLGMIYESRPNVTVDAFALALKSGNAILLRGSSSALHSNKALVKAIKLGLAKSKISPEVVQLLEKADRKQVEQMLQLTDYLDLIIPRGGAGLIKMVVNNAKVKTIETGVGNCHIYVHSSADQQMALDIIENAKTQRPGVCNACETVLVDKEICGEFLPALAGKLAGSVEIRGCTQTQKVIKCKPAEESDWAEEFLDLILAVKVVENIEQAIEHIGKYGSLHSEAIVSSDYDACQRFQTEVDAAAVYVNASTRFTDGAVFGFGCEMGISTQKMHARGPMGLNELVTYKYVISGDGQIRG